MTDTYAPTDPKGAVIAFNEGAQLISEGDEAGAAAAWHRALELDPALVPAALNLITYYNSRSDHATELKLWDQVIGVDPFDTDHLVLQAAAFRRADQHAEAIQNYQRAISIYPYFKFWYHELAAIYRDLGDQHEAGLWQSRGNGLDADVAEMCYEDGVRHAEEARWTSARTCFEAVLDDFPANLDARLRLTAVLEECGTPREIENQFEQALDLTQAAKALVSFRMGNYYSRRGDRTRAEECYRRALESEPRYWKAERSLAALHAVKQPRAAAAPVQKAAPVQEAAPVTPKVEERVFQPDEIGMERIDTIPPSDLPKFRAPNPRLPWEQQLRQVLDQALSLSSPGGVEPRVGIVIEQSRELAGIVSHTLSELVGIGRSLRADGEQSHVFVVELGNEARGGWLGRDDVFSQQLHEWSRTAPGTSLHRGLELISQASAGKGFNCVLLISFGRCLEEFDARQLISMTGVYGVCAIYPHYHYVDMKSLLAPAAPNFMEILV